MPGPEQRRSAMSKLWTHLIMLGVGFLLAELALQVADRLSPGVHRILSPPWVVETPMIPDDRLVRRGNPLHPEHDRRGYRNREALGEAEMVILGDSHAYGPADPRDAWPSVLAHQTRRVVYNMALPTYGPAQSLLLLEDALALRPQLVIVAPYFGNDFYDSFMVARRHPELARSVAPALRTAADQLEESEPIQTRYRRAYRLGQSIDVPPPAGV